MLCFLSKLTKIKPATALLIHIIQGHLPLNHKPPLVPRTVQYCIKAICPAIALMWLM
jgi:hypothetical protein